MSETIDRVQEHYKWTAYLKLKGQTWAQKENEILNEFESFVQALRGVGVDYNIIVMVEGRAPRKHRSEYPMKNIKVKVAREEPGA